MTQNELRRLAMEGLRHRINTFQTKIDEAKKTLSSLAGSRPSPLRGRKKLTAAQRKAISIRMKAYHRERGGK